MRAVDVPQADDLATVRAAVAVVSSGAETTGDVERMLGVSARHAGYRVHAARILGWLAPDDDDKLRVTASGQRLLSTPARGEEEALRFREALVESPFIRRLSPALLEETAPDLARLTGEIRSLTPLAEATARRRAATLLRWHEQAWPRVRPLFSGSNTPTAPATNPHIAPSDGILASRVHISNFGPIRDLTVVLQPFSVIIGRNAVGKSTFMDTFALVSDCMELGVSAALRRRGALLEDLLWFGKGDSIGLEFDLVLPPGLSAHSSARYELEVGRLESGAIGLRKERLSLGAVATGRATGEERPRGTTVHEDNPPGWRTVISSSEQGNAFYRSETTPWKTTFHFGNDRLALSWLPPETTRFPVATRVRELFARGVQRLVLHASVMAKPCSPLLGAAFELDGSNLPMVVRQLERDDPERHADWIAHVREALPDVDRVEVVERSEDRHLYLRVRYRGGLELPAWRLSEGTLRVLALTLVPFGVARDAIFLIEEPENGVHPQALEAVHETLAWPMGTQVIVATHSPVFVRIVEPRQLLCFTKERGETRVVSGEQHPAIRAWKQDVDLGALFAADVLS